jgi:hypothetical protein
MNAQSPMRMSEKSISPPAGATVEISGFRTILSNIMGQFLAFSRARQPIEEDCTDG